MVKTRARTAVLATTLLHVLLLGTGIAVAPDRAGATVLNQDRQFTYSPSVPTSVFAVPFAFIGADDLKLTKTLIASGVGTTLTRNVDYTVRLPAGSTQGSVTTFVAVTNAYTLKIERLMAYTQPTTFTDQGPFLPKRHEDAYDRLEMQIQQVVAAAGTDGAAAVATHVAQADPHPQYAILAGRAGGQNLRGGTAAGENLQLVPTSNATPGKLLWGSDAASAYDDVNNRLGIGTASPTLTLDVVGSGKLSGTLTVPTLYGSAASGGDLQLSSTSHATKHRILFGTSGYDEVNNRLGLGTAAPSYTLDVAGNARLGSSDKLVVATDGNIYDDVDNDDYFISGGTLSPGASGTPGLHFWGNANGSTPSKLQLYANTLVLSDGTGSAFVTLTSSGWAFGAGAVTPDITGVRKLTATDDIVGMRKTVTGFGASYTTSTSDCGAIIESSTTGATVTLHDASATSDGCQFTVVLTAADNSTLNIATTDATEGFEGSCVGVTGAGAATVTELTGTAGKQLQLGATGNKGDSVTVAFSNTLNRWIAHACTGEWASQP